MILKFFAGFLLISCLLFRFESSAQKDDYTLLWRIEGNNLKAPSYLFGTMHVKDARAFNFSDSVLLAIEKTENFALELHPDTLMYHMFNKFSEDDLNFKQLFEEHEYEKLSERIKNEKGFDLDRMHIKNPMMIRSLLTPSLSKEDDKQTFIDAYLYGIARTHKKKIFGLEKVRDQTDIFYGATKKEQREKLLEVLEIDSVKYVKGVDSLTLVYSTGNLDAIQRLVERSGLIDSIMIKRNRVMENSLRGLMHKAPTFAAVGCAHLPGEHGLIDMLRKAGYTVTPVKASFTGVAKRYKIDPLKMEWQTFRDENHGFEIKTPGMLIPTDIIPGMNMLIYPDLITEAAFLVMTIDMRGSKQALNEADLLDKMVENFTSAQDYDSLKKKRIVKNGQPATEISGINGNEHMIMHFTLKDNLLYFQFANSKNRFADQAYFDYFFNSFTTFEPQQLKQVHHSKFVNEHGAYTVKVPLSPKESKIRYDQPSEYDLHMAIATDMPNMENYLISYNDLPVGYHFDGNGKVFNQVLEEYKNLGKILSDPDTIWLSGYEGREYELMLNDSYYAICRVYVRGNRVYRVIQQNLNPDIKELENKHFFDSFSFSPFVHTELVNFKPDNANFTIRAFPEFKVLIDSLHDHNSYLNQTVTHHFKDFNSGGAYLFEFSELSEYFKINNIDSFYLNMLEDNILSWSDSLMSVSDVKIGSVSGKEAITYDKYTEQSKRHRLWLHDKKLFYMTSFVAEEALRNEVSNTFFSSYQKAGEIDQFDYYSSKTKDILQALMSADSSIYMPALGALSYYEFSIEDLPLIYAALKKEYPDDDQQDGARATMAHQLALISDSSTISFIETLYNSEKTPEILKVALLVTLNSMEHDRANGLFTRLLFEHTPENTGNSSWKIFQPFSDSLELAKTHFNDLLQLMNRKQYRSNVLSLVSDMIYSDSLSKKFLEEHYAGLIQFADDDLSDYLAEIDTTENEYFYNNKISAYLTLLNNIPNKAFAESFTREILDSKIIGSLRTRALTARIFHNLRTDKREITSLLNAIETRYTIMKALYQAKREGEIPKNYRKQEEFAKLCFYEYLTYDDEGPSEIKLLGQVKEEDSIIYVFSFNYIDDEENNYIGLSRIHSSKDGIPNFENHISYSPWEVVEQDWESQAKQYVTDLIEYGY